MSKRHQSGDIVTKKVNAGFIGEECIIRIVVEPGEEKYLMPCFQCGDPLCIEWPNLEVLDENCQVVGKCYHVSDCEMED